ncbi:MAG: hypothetical protein M1837_007385 [Sclerophora amabilis]|nr:MAG: hypothetical protein M1837_007385 [Sclerophora amabilis]
MANGINSGGEEEESDTVESEAETVSSRGLYDRLDTTLTKEDFEEILKYAPPAELGLAKSEASSARMSLSRLYDQFDTSITREEFDEILQYAPPEEIQLAKCLSDQNNSQRESNRARRPKLSAISYDARLQNGTASTSSTFAFKPPYSNLVPSSVDEKIDRFIRDHPFIGGSLTTPTTSARRSFIRNVYDYARANRLSSEQAGAQVSKGRTIYRRQRRIQKVCEWVDVALLQGRSREDELSRIRDETGWNTDELDGNAIESDDLDSNLGTEIDDVTNTLRTTTKDERQGEEPRVFICDNTFVIQTDMNWTSRMAYMSVHDRSLKRKSPKGLYQVLDKSKNNVALSEGMTAFSTASSKRRRKRTTDNSQSVSQSDLPPRKGKEEKKSSKSGGKPSHGAVHNSLQHECLDESVYLTPRTVGLSAERQSSPFPPSCESPNKSTSMDSDAIDTQRAKRRNKSSEQYHPAKNQIKDNDCLEDEVPDSGEGIVKSGKRKQMTNISSSMNDLNSAEDNLKNPLAEPTSKKSRNRRRREARKRKKAKSSGILNVESPRKENPAIPESPQPNGADTISQHGGESQVSESEDKTRPISGRLHSAATPGPYDPQSSVDSVDQSLVHDESNPDAASQNLAGNPADPRDPASATTKVLNTSSSHNRCHRNLQYLGMNDLTIKDGADTKVGKSNGESRGNHKKRTSGRLRSVKERLPSPPVDHTANEAKTAVNNIFSADDSIKPQNDANPVDHAEENIQYDLKRLENGTEEQSSGLSSPPASEDQGSGDAESLGDASEIDKPRASRSTVSTSDSITPPSVRIKRKTTSLRSPFFKSQVRRRASAGAVSCIPFPPFSKPHFGLIQERLAHDPYKLLIAVTFLNRTRGTQAIPVFYQLMERYPAPEDMAAADLTEVADTIRHLGLQHSRARRYVQLAQAWIENPPVKGRRHRKLNYPCAGDGKKLKPLEIIDDGDERTGAWEVAHLPTAGPYAIDSWRIFCRDELRGLAQDWTGAGRENGHEDFEPEWKRVLPKDKELRAYLRWLWLKEGWEWDPDTGEKRRASEDLMERGREGTIIWEEEDGTEDCDMEETKQKGTPEKISSS